MVNVRDWGCASTRGTKMNRRWLEPSPAHYNENFELELSGVWDLRTIQDHHQLVKEKRLHLVFLMKTKFINKNCDFFKNKIGF